MSHCCRDCEVISQKNSQLHHVWGGHFISAMMYSLGQVYGVMLIVDVVCLILPQWFRGLVLVEPYLV